MYIGDWVLRAIDAEIAPRPPENGGALLGPRGRPFVTAFVPDPDAATSSSTYRPSRTLAARVRELEGDALLELKGMVHSHPRRMDRPSEQDARELATGLRLNGHMPCYLAPIVTELGSDAANADAESSGEDGGGPPEHAGAPELGAHELALTRGKISFYAGWRTQSGDTADVRPLRVGCVPLLRDLDAVAAALGGGAPGAFSCDLGAGAVTGGRLALPCGELLVVVNELYPTMPPIALFTPSGGDTEQLHLRWPVDAPLTRRLVDAVSEALRPYGDSGDALFARSAGLLTRVLSRRRVLVAGCGSVGSYMAEQLARSGVGALELVDPDDVAPENLSRASYELADVGRRKAEALRDRLHRIAPRAAVASHVGAVEAFEPAALDELVRRADLVVAATDTPAAQRALDRFAYARGKPALFVGVYAGARGGEVILTRSEETACYQCATRVRHAAERSAGQVSGVLDYGTGRLHAEVALGADIQHVASAAVKLGLSLLVRGEAGATLGALCDEIVSEGATYLTMSTVARYWFYPSVFGDVAGQAAFQSVWLTPGRDPECAVCGAPEHREDPLDLPLRAPGRDAFLDRSGGA